MREVFDCSNSGVIISNPTGAQKTKGNVPMSFYVLKKLKRCNETVFYSERCAERQARLALRFPKYTAFSKAHSLRLSVLVKGNERGIMEY